MNIVKVLYQIINHQNNTEVLTPILENNSFNWEFLYETASRYLVVPALHNAIIAKGFKGIVPKDFFGATKHITKLNGNRNQQIIKQIESISALFISEKIDYVLIKGSAMLILNPYRGLSDRMVGDIDILVREKDLIRSSNLLLGIGYKSIPKSPDPAYKNHRHLPRLISKNEIAAVELHNWLLEVKQNIALPNNILDCRVLKDQHYIPTTNYLYKQSVLSHQINDAAYYTWYLSFKVLYDCMSLKHTNRLKLDNNDKLNKYIRRFWVIHSLYIDNKNLTYTSKEKKQIAFFKWRKKRLKFNSFYKNCIYIYLRKHTFLIRLWYLIKDKRYRRYIFLSKK